MLSWGANSYGQLGQGFCSEECITPTKVVVDENSLDSIIQICGGAGHTLILNKSGEILSCGWNTVNQLGLDEGSTIFKNLPIKLNCKQISCGWDFSAGIDTNNRLYVWGSNSFNQLGFPKQDHKIIKKPKIVENILIKYVSCGLRHTAVITLEDKVFTAGSNTAGQLGYKDSNLSGFQEIPNLPRIKSIACGQKHTIALSYGNELYVWGDNKWGQLGFEPSTVAKSYTPFKLNIPINDPVKVFCGWTHNVILTLENKLWSWGRNNYGQLGRIKANFDWIPHQIHIGPVSSFAIAAEHNIAAVGSQVYAWGWNEHGNCGNGDVDNIYEPQLIVTNVKDILCVGAGTGQSFAVGK